MTSLKLQMGRAKPRRISIEDKRQRKANPRPLLALEKWTIKKNDLVEVNQGADEGRRGRVLSRQWRDNTVVVEGVSVEVTEELDPESLNLWDPQWQRKEGTPQPVLFHHVSLIDPTTNERTNVDWEKRGGIWTRISRSTGAVVPLPPKPPPEDDLATYAEELCTRREDVLRVTYVPLPDYSVRDRKTAAWIAKLSGRNGSATDDDGSSDLEVNTGLHSAGRSQ